jgi:hypothetical protein
MNQFRGEVERDLEPISRSRSTSEDVDGECGPAQRPHTGDGADDPDRGRDEVGDEDALAAGVRRGLAHRQLEKGLLAHRAFNEHLKETKAHLDRDTRWL